MESKKDKKTIRKKKKNLRWRPKKIDDDVLAKLEQWFLYSMTHEEACLYAKISPATLYRYLEVHPDFRERIELLRKNTSMRAKINKVKAINEWDVKESGWWLERKNKEEFWIRHEVTGPDGEPLQVGSIHFHFPNEDEHKFIE